MLLELRDPHFAFHNSKAPFGLVLDAKTEVVLAAERRDRAIRRRPAAP